MEEKKWNAGSIGLTFAGSFLGAGYVSGEELLQVFGSFGGGGLLGVLAALALLAVFGLALMYIISRTGIAEMDAVLVPWKRLAWLRKLSSALQLILLFGVIAIMYAGGGALLEQLFSLPTWLGRTLMAVPETADAELPMLALAYGLSRPLGYVYGVLLLLCMYGSALSMTVAITTYASARSERVEKRRGWFILALGALGYAASSVGFGDLISVVYPVFGYCSSVFIVCLLVHAAQTRKKEYKFFENSGTKEEEISS